MSTYALHTVTLNLLKCNKQTEAELGTKERHSISTSVYIS